MSKTMTTAGEATLADFTSEQIAEAAPEGFVTLAQHLDQGGALSATWATILGYDLPTQGDVGLERYRRDLARCTAIYEAKGERIYYPEWFEGSGMDLHRADLERMYAEDYSEAAWVLEVVADPDLADRARAAVPQRALADETVAAGEQLDVQRRPFDLTLEDRGVYRCGFTGAECEGMAVVVTGRGWFGDETADVADRLVFSPEALATWLASVCGEWKATQA
jgi:hypothetical protein